MLADLLLIDPPSPDAEGPAGGMWAVAGRPAGRVHGVDGQPRLGDVLLMDPGPADDEWPAWPACGKWVVVGRSACWSLAAHQQSSDATHPQMAPAGPDADEWPACGKRAVAGSPGCWRHGAHRSSSDVGNLVMAPAWAAADKGTVCGKWAVAGPPGCWSHGAHRQSNDVNHLQMAPVGPVAHKGPACADGKMMLAGRKIHHLLPRQTKKQHNKKKWFFKLFVLISFTSHCEVFCERIT